MATIPRPKRPMSRRTLIQGALLAAAGTVTGAAAAVAVPRLFGWDRPPLGGGYASAADEPDLVNHPNVTVSYYVETSEPVVAFTFDDGPGPRWTPMALDALEASDVPATFFMVGRNLTENAEIVRGRLGRHEVGNHSWSHDDLATLDLAGVTDELTRTHEAIRRFTGRAPTLLRPPYGHLGGSTLLAADSMGYDITLWSHQMHERRYVDDPPGQVRDIVEHVRPGSIILAHDVGRDDRLVVLRQLTEMFRQLRDRGFRFTTVSELLSLATAAPTSVSAAGVGRGSVR
jgi:peptidoglycan/xylan/chitin deacetylase (PgdA/CDA1 family)